MASKEEVIEHLSFESFYQGELPQLKATSGGNYQALCPFHEDKNPSLSVNFETGLFKCFACDAHGDIIEFYMRRHGCNFKEALEALGRQAGVDLTAKPRVQYKPLTIREFAEAKKLPYDFLVTQGVGEYQYPPEIFDGCRTVNFPYKDKYGGKALSNRRRFGDGKDKFKWEKGNRTRLYGLWKLQKIRTAGWCLLVEGESDALTCWLHGLPALGIPGKKTWKSSRRNLSGDELQALKDIQIYLWVEPDATGLAAEVAVDLPKLLVIPAPKEFKDLSEAHCQGRDIKVLLEEFKSTAKPPHCTAETGLPISAPEFPAEAMTGPAAAFARTFSLYLESPPVFFFFGYLTILGHLVSESVTLASVLDPQPRLFTIILGESGTVRKSTALSKVVQFFTETLSADALNIIKGISSGEGLPRCLKKNKRLCIVQDELKSLIQKMNIETSILLPCIGTLFESNHTHAITKKDSIKIDDAHLSLLGASTVETYKNMFSEKYSDIGFTNRLFLVLGKGEKKFSLPLDIPQNDINILKEQLVNILGFVNKLSEHSCYRYPIEPEAKAIWDAWYYSIPDSTCSVRLDAYGFRLMILLAVNNMRQTIDSEIMQQVIVLLDYQYRVRKFAQPVDTDTIQGKVEAKIRQALEGRGLSRRSLQKAVHYERYGLKLFDDSLKILLAAGEIILDPQTGLYNLSPLVSPP